MPTFTYNDQQYELVDPDHWYTMDAIRVEALSGRKPAELIQDYKELGAHGLHALVWVSLRRAGQDVAWDKLELPWYDTLLSMTEPVVEPPDPSTASTEEQKAD